MINRKTIAWVCVGMALAGVSLPQPARAQDGEKVPAITLPSADVTLSFKQPGTIVKIGIEQILRQIDPKTGETVETLKTVKDVLAQWDQVKAGQVLARQDSAAEEIQLEQLKAQAEDTVRIEAQEAQLAQRQVDLEKMKKAYDDGAATKQEYEHARLEVRIGELSVRLAKFEQAQAMRKYREAKQRLRDMRLECPIDGLVAMIHHHKGETVDKQQEVIQVIKTDPLWIDVAVPKDLAETLAKGGTALVEFPATKDMRKGRPPTTHAPTKVAGRIVHLAGKMDSASQTRIVRVEVANADGRPAGGKVEVSFPAKGENPQR